MKFRNCLMVLGAALIPLGGLAQTSTSTALSAAVTTRVAAEYPSLLELYQHLHTHPDLSFHEEATAKRIAEELNQAGFTVTSRVGKTGVVGVLKNGAGPTILVRTDLDGLPVKEQTGLPYASTATTKDDQGVEVSTMHACGHDIHMTVFVGTARLLKQLAANWQGTIIMIGQPAEERGGGARAMLADGLFIKFPKPDYCLALHCNSSMPAGTVGYVEGNALANVDSVDITIRGVGGHGSSPQVTKDPIVLAAETIMALQTIVSREIEPGEPAVVTVGSIHGGTKHNIIPDDVHLQLTLRSYSERVRTQTVESIRRITRGLAIAAGIPENRMPTVEVSDEFTPFTYNDPALTRRVAAVFQTWIGEKSTLRKKPVMGGEDFGRFGTTPEKVPICMFWLGAVNPDLVVESEKTGKPLPSLHSSLFAPLPEPTIKTGVTAMTAALLNLAGKQ